MKTILVLAIAAALGSCSAQKAEPRLEFAMRYCDAVESEFREPEAFETVQYVSGFWRVAGNEGFDSVVAYVAGELSKGGYSRVSGPEQPESDFYFRVDTSKLHDRLTWTPHGGEIKITNRRNEIVFEDNYERTPVLLTLYSHAAQLKAPLIDVGNGSAAGDYDGKDLRGKIVMGDAPASILFLHAVKKYGAAGVVSAFVPDYNRPEANPDLVAQEEIPLSETAGSFALKISRGAANKIRAALQDGPCQADIRIETEIKPSHLKTVIAEIRGTSVPAERIVCVSHLDHYKPGANDNASGVAATLEMAMTLRRLIEQKKIDRPQRTLTFFWVDEYESEFQPGGLGYWRSAYPIQFVKTKSVFALDMVGEDVTKTGGIFRVEKYPDPSAIWTRSPDEHSGWGVDFVDESQLKGSFINDYVWHVSETYARLKNWPITRNPFEGGSDHQIFVDAKIPAVLLWHFPDQFYHTNSDDPDKVSAGEMKRVITAVTASVLGLASLAEIDAETLADLIRREGEKRLHIEMENSRQALAGDSNKERERRILRAWATWYSEAIRSVADIAIKPDQRLLTILAEEAEEFETFGTHLIDQL